MIEQKIKPNSSKLKLTPVEIEYEKNRPDIAKNKLTAAQNAPTVYYYGVLLPSSFIKKMIIDSNKFMPMCYVCFNDIYNLLHDVGFPADNAKLSIVIPSNNTKLGNIFMEFKITKYEVELIRNSGHKKIHFWGICNIEPLLIQEYKSYDSYTYDLFNNIASNTGLGFMSNVTSSSDKQIWLNPGRENYWFLQDTINKAWNGDSGFLWSFIDLYYNINYIDVEKSLSQSMDEIKWQMSSTISSFPDDNKNQTNIKEISPLLSNNSALSNTNSYFTGEKILNQSTDISLKRGYKRNVYFYDKDGNWSKKAGKYKIYGLDTISSLGNSDQTVILKGEPGSTDFYDKNKKNYYLGKIDTKNSYVDFLWAKMQNSENINDLQKIHMQILLPQANFNIRRFEKIKMQFLSNDVSPNGLKNNFKLNGEWLVTGFSLEWDGSSLIQRTNIIKRELEINK